jgi:hypothetical protein
VTPKPAVVVESKLEDKQIFSLKSKMQGSRERYNLKAADYLENYKMSIYF